MFEWLGSYLLIAMNWINQVLISDYALCIVVFVILLKLVTLPFDIKQRRSTARMQAVQPELAKLQKRYANNAELMRKKQQELYKKNNVSMTAGCLPMLVTMLFFMVFLRAMNLWTDVKTIELVLEPTVAKLDSFRMLWVKNIWMPDSGMSPYVMEFDKFQAVIGRADKVARYFTAEQITYIKSLTEASYNLAMEPLTSKYVGLSNGWFILPVIAGGSMVLTTMISNKLNKTPAPQQGGMNPNIMMYAFAALSVYICITSSAAFAVYWVASNVISLAITVTMHFISKRNKSDDEEVIIEGEGGVV